MNVALLAVDSKYPNLALMKISAYHKSVSDSVEWYNPFDRYDRLYMSKVFSFTPDYDYYINNVCGEIIRGGTGYDIHSSLPEEIDMMQPDYSIYPTIDNRTSYGFLTRGCPNKCKWCVVPQKEGNIRPYMDIDEITIGGMRPYAILMDNNVLASSYGLSQIEKIVYRKYHVDFNQALDARLVTDDVARLLSQVKWIKRIRFGCDTTSQIGHCADAIERIRQYGYKGEFFLYCILMDDIEEAYHRIECWKEHEGKVLPFAQPFRDPYNPIRLYRNGKRTWHIGLTEKNCTCFATLRTLNPARAFIAENTFNN